MKRAFVLGNGPSLAGVDFGFLRKHGTIFGTNRVYLKDIPDYYLCVNPLIWEQFGDEALDILRGVPKFIGNKCVRRDDLVNNVYVIDTSASEPSFSTEAPYWEGHTVTYMAIQMAVKMGFDEIVLLGVDHYYGEISSPNARTASTGYDENHFDPEYFGKGVEYHQPDLAMSEVAYAYARKECEERGIRIVNASASTKLDVFDREPLYSVLNPDIKVSAIVSAYKAERFMPGLIEDLEAQTIDGLEVVVVCRAGSKEDAMAEAWRKRSRHYISLIHPNDPLPTVYDAWNRGIKYARGKYITNANTDDRHFPNAYEIMYNILEGSPCTDVVYHNDYITWEEMTPQEFVDRYAGQEIVAGRQENMPGVFMWVDYTKRKLNNGCFIGPHPMWRASLHQRYGMFAGHMKSAGDYEFWLRIAREDNFKHIPAVLGLYRARVDGIELSDVELSGEESFGALLLHQADHLEIRPYTNELARITVGDSYAFAEKESIEKNIRRVMGA